MNIIWTLLRKRPDLEDMYPFYIVNFLMENYWHIPECKINTRKYRREKRRRKIYVRMKIDLYIDQI